jgi:glycosyltransferase involved in cell wall biosynthesis
MKKPIYSFILPVFNSANYLVKCINSLIQQKTTIPFEVIIIYDESLDKTYDVCLKYVNKYSFVRMYKGRGVGCGAARNIGLKKALGKYIVFIDADDWISLNLIQHTYPIIKKKDIDFICFGFSYVTNNSKNQVVKKPFFKCKTLEGNSIFFDSILDKNIYPEPWNKVYKKVFLDKHDILYPELKEWEDIFFTRQSSFFAKKVQFIQDNLYYARINMKSRSRTYPDSFFTDGLKLLGTEKKFIIKNAKDNLMLRYYYAHHIKVITFFIVKCAFQSKSYKNFLMHHKIAINRDYYNYVFQYNVLKLLNFKFQALALLSFFPNFLWFLSRLILKLFNFKTY